MRRFAYSMRVVEAENSMQAFKVICLLAVLITGSGCGGGGDGASSGAQSATMEGVWEGTCSIAVYQCVLGICVRDHYDTVPAIAFAARDGRLHLMTAGFELAFVGHASVSGGHVSGKLRNVCYSYSQGSSVFGYVSIDGSYAFQRSADIEYDMDDCFGDGVFNLVFDNTSRQSASLSAIEGVWSTPQAAISIEQDGQFLGSTNGGCQLSGNIVPGSETVSIFDVDMLVENCGSSDGQYSGLASVVGGDTAPVTLIVSTLRSGRIWSMGLSR